MERANHLVIWQRGLFDLERRLEAISSNKVDPLESINKIMRPEDFHANIVAVTENEARVAQEQCRPQTQSSEGDQVSSSGLPYSS
jgi:hypothetical protein